MFYENLTKLCEDNNIKITTLLNKLNISTSAIARWKNGVIPTGEILTKIADYFNVSVDLLLGRTETQTDDLDIITIQRARQNMTEKDKTRMMDMLRVTFDYAFDNNKGDDDNK